MVLMKHYIRNILFFTILVFFVNKMKTWLYVQCIYGVCYWGNCCSARHKKYVFCLPIPWILSFTSFGTQLKFLELLLIIIHFLLSSNSPNNIRNSIWQMNLVYPWIHGNIKGSLKNMECQYQVIYHDSLIWIFYQKRWHLMIWNNNIYSQCRHNSPWHNKLHNLTTYTL